ncbi:MAG: RDD family protein [Clostridia bacterium]|nr:RDD family protein [Clostridia bacterium]
MELFKKRVKAQVWDFIFIGLVATLIHFFIPNIYLLLIIVIFLHIFRDLLFRNASLGKKFQGIMVIDNGGGVPTIKQMILRNIPTVLLMGYEFTQIKNNDLRIGDMWAGTRVVLKKSM